MIETWKAVTLAVLLWHLSQWLQHKSVTYVRKPWGSRMVVRESAVVASIACFIVSFIVMVDVAMFHFAGAAAFSYN